VLTYISYSNAVSSVNVEEIDIHPVVPHEPKNLITPPKIAGVLGESQMLKNNVLVLELGV
jgi:hypothetical protein